MKPLIIILGLRGSGRLTVAKELAENGWSDGKRIRTFREAREAEAELGRQVATDRDALAAAVTARSTGGARRQKGRSASFSCSTRYHATSTGEAR